MDMGDGTEQFSSELLQLTSGLRTRCAQTRADADKSGLAGVTQGTRALADSLSAAPFAPLQQCASYLQRVEDPPPQVDDSTANAVDGLLDALRLACGLVEQLLDHLREDSDAVRIE